MGESLISFKGSKEGIYIYIKEGNFKTIKHQLDDKLKNAGSFFNGGKVINIKGKRLTSKEKEELKGIIERKYGIAMEEPIKDEGDEVPQEGTKVSENCFKGIEEGHTKFIKATIRSGQVIEFDGNIVILGDVNPGGVITAKGNIMVFGTLRGVAIAGSDGNTKAIIAAFNLQPTQLRIADRISRSPDNESMEERGPEVAKIKDDTIVIQPYLNRK